MVEKKSSKKIIAVIVVVVIVVIALLLLSMNGTFNANKYKATIFVHVTSAHVVNVVNINLYADDHLFKTDSLTALSTVIYQYDAWFSGSPSDIVISGTGQGGALGDSSASSTITVADGGTYNVYLIL
jgi:hypothetical protein